MRLLRRLVEVDTDCHQLGLAAALATTARCHLHAGHLDAAQGHLLAYTRRGSAPTPDSSDYDWRTP